MSTPESKIAVIEDFLRQRASLGRVTNMQEVAEVAGKRLAARSLRRIDTPVKREKVEETLQAIDRKSVRDNGVALSAIVVHWEDNDFPSRLGRSLERLGLSPNSQGAQKENVFSAYSEYTGFKAPETDTLRDRLSRHRARDTDDDGVETLVSKLTEAVQEYVGRHRRDDLAIISERSKSRVW